MNKILKTIYQSYSEMPADVNPLETPETFNAFWDFLNTYFGDDKPYDERNEAELRFCDLISDYQANAFEAGFKTAVQLLMRD